MVRIPQPPDSRTYSAEVTSSPSNLPHHRRCAFHALAYNTTSPPKCQEKMRKNYVLFCTFFKAFFGYFVTIGEYLKINTLTSSPLRHYHQTLKLSTFSYAQKHPNCPSNSIYFILQLGTSLSCKIYCFNSCLIKAGRLRQDSSAKRVNCIY